MTAGFCKNQISTAVAAALGAAAMAMANMPVAAGPNATTATTGKYVAGDFHNHTTCSDGSMSLQKLVKKSTDTVANGGDTPWGLDWFVQAGHGNSGGTRNCTLVEDATLSTPLYPYVATIGSVTGVGPNTTWSDSIGASNVKGDTTAGVGYMWRWQSIQEYEYPLLEYLGTLKGLPLFQGIESIVPGHEHGSMSVVTGQMPASLDNFNLPTTAQPPTGQRYLPQGNANALAQWVYCFDLGVTDLSRGDQTGTSIGNNWDCSVPGQQNSSNPSWNATGHKLVTPSANAVGSAAGTLGHAKLLQSLLWMQSYDPTQSYYVPAHLERPGPFTADGNQGWNVEHLRDLNNTAPQIAFGFESQPGHGAASNRGEYQVLRNSFPGVSGKIDSVGGTTYGGTGVYAAQIGGVWDALLGEGRNWWFFASSDFHNRGSFGNDDRRSTSDFFPGEYQRTYAFVPTRLNASTGTADYLRPQYVVDGLRSGNAWAAQGQLIDRLSFVACASYSGLSYRSNAAVENLAVSAAEQDVAPSAAGCATMGQKLKIRAGGEVVITVVVRDPAGSNYSPYTFNNPSLLQIGVQQPMNQPVLDHIDLIDGAVTGYVQPGSPNYAGAWPANTAWLHTDGTTADLSVVPAAAKNTSAQVIRTFNANGANAWTAVSAPDGTTFLKMTYRIPAVQASQYVRLRGTNLPPSVPYETDANGNPLADLYTNANDTTKLRIPCTIAHSAASQFDGCPDHLAVASGSSPITGQKAVSYDVAAWADLWFYSNPIYVEVGGSYPVAGVN